MTITSWRRVMTVVFWVAVALVAAAQLWIVLQGTFFMRLWEDEAFNLTVPINLVNGLGYTSDGTLSGSQLTPFDPRISTGPVVLLPIAAVIALGAEPVIGGRLVILAFYAALVVGLWRLGDRLGGRWAALAVVCVPLGWNTWNSGSPIQSPVDILGEVPAAALLVWAFVVLRKKPWLAGLLIGLALQTKLLGALAALPIALAIYLLADDGVIRRLLRVVLCALVAVIPNALYELWKFVALGPETYWTNLREFYWFFRSGGQNIDPVAPMKKLAALGNGWFSPTWLTVLFFIAILAAVCVAVLRRPVQEFPEGSDAGSNYRELTAYALSAVVGFVIWCGWWLTSTQTPNWPRYAAMAMYIFVPIIVAAAIRALGEQWRTRPWGARSRFAAGAVAAVIVITLGAQTSGHLRIADQSRFGEALADQRVIAAEVAEANLDVIVTEWGPTVSIIVLAGAHAALNDVPEWNGTPELRQNWDLSEDGLEAFASTLDEECGDVPVRTDRYALCFPS